MTTADNKGPVEILTEKVRIEDREYADAGSAGLAEYVSDKQVTFREALQGMDVLDARYDPTHGSYVVVTPEKPSTELKTERVTEYAERGVSVRELGYSSPSPFTAWTREEHNSKLRDKQGLTEYYRMKRTDGTVRGALRQLKSPILGARWVVNPASQSTRDQNAAKFVEKNLFHGMSSTWSSTLENVLLMAEYGHMIMEKVWTDQDVPGRVTLRKLAPRHPLDVRDWRYDANGGPDGVVMEPTEMTGSYEGIYIPIEKLAIFSLEAEAGDLRGISVLRSAYKHWFYKDTLYKIDAIQKERHGIGVPIIKLPPGFSAQDKQLADEIGRNLRTNERSHIAVPPGWEILFAKLEGQPVDCLKSINHHDEMIMRNILAPFNSDGVDIDKAELFLRSTRYIAQTVADIMNKFVIEPLIDMNFSRVGYPELKARRIGEDNEIRTRSFALRNHVGAGVIVPDEPLEAYIRDELDLPAADPNTARPQMAPQLPDDEGDDAGSKPSGAPNGSKPSGARVGPPRQQTKPPSGTGRGNTGTDRSGGNS